ncbi:hypothetical protein NQZ68_021943, partial [Dissostichus eleginoides]
PASHCDWPVPHLVLRLGADVLPGRPWLRGVWKRGAALQLRPGPPRAQPVLLQPVQTHHAP